MVRTNSGVILNLQFCFFAEKSKSELLKNGAFFEWQDQLTVDESKRPANNTIAQNMFGFGK